MAENRGYPMTVYPCPEHGLHANSYQNNWCPTCRAPKGEPTKVVPAVAENRDELEAVQVVQNIIDFAEESMDSTAGEGYTYERGRADAAREIKRVLAHREAEQLDPERLAEAMYTEGPNGQQVPWGELPVDLRDRLTTQSARTLRRLAGGGPSEGPEPECDCGHAGTPDDKHLHTCSYGRWLLAHEVNEKIRAAGGGPPGQETQDG